MAFTRAFDGRKALGIEIGDLLLGVWNQWRVAHGIRDLGQVVAHQLIAQFAF